MTGSADITESDMMGNPEFDALEKKLEEANDKMLRALAEAENIRRRAVRDVEEAHRYGIKKLLEELIPVLDSLEQGLAMGGLDSEGLALTLKMLQKILEKFNVTEINPINNELFNPTYHEVMMTQDNPDLPVNAVITVMQKGYTLHDRVIRPARVVITKSK